VILAGTVFGVGTSARTQANDRLWASANDRRCSNRTLQGRYATVVEGYFIGAPTPIPFRSVAMTHFDGRGNVRQVDHAVINGTPPPMDWLPATGTYSVNADCTGESELDIPGNPSSPLSIRFVLGDEGNLLLSVLSEPGYAVTSTSTRIHQPE
jgi:hypothetical protein